MSLAVENLSFWYRAHRPILQDLTAEFPPGSMWAITGSSGSGKSTLLYLMGLLLRPRQGTVCLNGRAVTSTRERDRLRATEIGFVFQDAALDGSRSVVDNIAEPLLYGNGSYRSARSRAHELIDRFEVDIEPDQRPGEVSGGQAQRIALCRAIVNDPPVVLADEPTGNLDRSTATVVLRELTNMARDGRTVVIATHSPWIVEQCDDRLDLENGHDL